MLKARAIYVSTLGAFSVAVGCNLQIPQLTMNGVTAKSVGATGGTVTASDGSSLDIPPGALSKDTIISMVPTSQSPSPTGASILGVPYTFGPEGTQFAKPVTLTLAYDPSMIPSGSTVADIAVYTAPAGSRDYTTLSAKVADASHVTAQTMHFSTFVVAVPSCAIACEGGASSAGASKCSCAVTCHNHAYAIECANGACACKTDDAETKKAHASSCDAKAVASAYTNACGYPGSFDDSAATPGDSTGAHGGTEDGGARAYDGGSSPRVDDGSDSSDGGSGTFDGGTRPPPGPDAEPFDTCNHTLTPDTSGGCVVNAQCHGHAYALACSSGGECACTTDGVATAQAKALCSNTQSLIVGYQQTCAYP